MRDFKVRDSKNAYLEHMTGRKCVVPECNGDLKDSIINFGESLNKDVLGNAQAKTFQTDLMVCMGSSMRVSPANMMAMTTAIMGKVVMVNLQKTPMDDACVLVIHEKCDKVMQLLFEKLGYQIPAFKLDRFAKVKLEEAKSGDTITVKGEDENGAPYTLFKQVKINGKVGSTSKFDSDACKI